MKWQSTVNPINKPAVDCSKSLGNQTIVIAGLPFGDPRWPDASFDPRGHAVLDIGAHIGAFSRYAVRRGACAVVAYEPEPSNADLFRHNLRDELSTGRVELREVQT